MNIPGKITDKYRDVFFEEKIVSIINWEIQDFAEILDFERSPNIVETEHYFIIFSHGSVNGDIRFPDKVRECLEFIKEFPEKNPMIASCWGYRVAQKNPEFAPYLILVECVIIFTINNYHSKDNKSLILGEIPLEKYKDFYRELNGG